MSEIHPSRADWHVITRTRGGVVSILKNLTLHAAKAAAHELRPDDDKLSERMAAAGITEWFNYNPSPSNIIETIIIGPEGWKPMTDPELAALVEELRELAGSLCCISHFNEPTGQPDWKPFNAAPLSELLQRSAAAITALAADNAQLVRKRDEAHEEIMLHIALRKGAEEEWEEAERELIAERDRTVAIARAAALEEAAGVAEAEAKDCVPGGACANTALEIAAAIRALAAAPSPSERQQPVGENAP